jgi:nitrate reductase NapAB chaperone NapD
MKIGVLKSRVEKLLSESYGKGTFKEEIKNFNRNVLSNKNISKLFFLYDELSTNKGYDQKLAEDFVFESITMFENIINKTDKRDLEKIKKWVISVNSHNQYTDIDNLFYNSGDVLHLENKVRSKKVIVESLKKTQLNENKETILLPLSSMVKVANKSIEDFISNLNESEKKELNLLLKEDELVLVEQFQNLKDEAVVKLIVVLEGESDESVKNTINETIDNIKSKKFDRLEYFKLKNLVDNI